MRMWLIIIVSAKQEGKGDPLCLKDLNCEAADAAQKSIKETKSEKGHFEQDDPEDRSIFVKNVHGKATIE